MTRSTGQRFYHGHSKSGNWSPTYKSWKWMKLRCTRPADKFFYLYGGRGITVCERWQGPAGFKNFLADMGERPDGMTLDRIDSNGNYEPGNCRWATATQQARNTRRVKMTEDSVNEIRGRHEHGESMKSIARRFGVWDSTIKQIVSRRTWKDVP